MLVFTHLSDENVVKSLEKVKNNRHNLAHSHNSSFLVVKVEDCERES